MSSVTVFFLVCLGLFAVTSWQSFALDGPVPTMSAQCQKRGYAVACLPWSIQDLEDNFCKNLPCAEKVEGWKGRYEKRQIGPPVDGTICGRTKICINQQCTTVNKNEMPKYIGSNKAAKCLNPK